MAPRGIEPGEYTRVLARLARALPGLGGSATLDALPLDQLGALIDETAAVLKREADARR